jgi:hypothetical protein
MTPFPTMFLSLFMLWWFFWAMVQSIGDGLRAADELLVRR